MKTIQDEEALRLMLRGEAVADEFERGEKVVVITRRQDNFYEAMYRIVKAQLPSYSLDLWMKQTPVEALSWLFLIERIEEAVGEGNVTVRPREETDASEPLMSDFFRKAIMDYHDGFNAEMFTRYMPDREDEDLGYYRVSLLEYEAST